jgi:hypothetical protein
LAAVVANLAQNGIFIMNCRQYFCARYAWSAVIVLIGATQVGAQTQPADPSFSSSSDVTVLDPVLSQLGTFRQGNLGTTLNFNVYNRPAGSGTTSTMSLVGTTSLGDSSSIALTTGTVTGLAPVGAGGTPNAAMHLSLTTNQIGNLEVSYNLEFASDSLPTAPHKSLAIAAYATVLRQGDFNGDGLVNAADYVTWRKEQGKSVTPYTQADNNGDGLVNTTDYNAWRANYSGASGSGAESSLQISSVPEPAQVLLTFVAALSAAPLVRIGRRIRR